MNVELWERWQRAADAADVAKYNRVSGNEWMQVLGYGPCESPIERRFWRILEARAEHFGFKARPQFKHGRYRYDFAVERDGRTLAVIECDGRQFHSTPEQLERDHAKDVSAEEAGFEVFRFSGREIHRDAGDCVEQVLFRLWRPEYRT
jgi:very-short-patch-repair endonuclease